MNTSDFQLDSQRIISTDFSLNKEFSIPPNLNVDLEGKTEVKNLSENTATVVFSLSIYNNKPLEEVPFQIKVVSEGKFSWNSTIEKDLLNNYLNFNAPSILLSYIRSVVSMITSYAGLSNFMIPLINFYKPSVSKEN
jgi:preprotein translocase subunit SecB